MLALRHWLSLDKEKKGGGREREREKETDFEIPQRLDGEKKKNHLNTAQEAYKSQHAHGRKKHHGPTASLCITMF